MRASSGRNARILVEPALEGKRENSRIIDRQELDLGRSKKNDQLSSTLVHERYLRPSPFHASLPRHEQPRPEDHVLAELPEAAPATTKLHPRDEGHLGGVDRSQPVPRPLRPAQRCEIERLRFRVGMRRYAPGGNQRKTVMNTLSPFYATLQADVSWKRRLTTGDCSPVSFFCKTQTWMGEGGLRQHEPSSICILRVVGTNQLVRTSTPAIEFYDLHIYESEAAVLIEAFVDSSLVRASSLAFVASISSSEWFSLEPTRLRLLCVWLLFDVIGKVWEAPSWCAYHPDGYNLHQLLHGVALCLYSLWAAIKLVPAISGDGLPARVLC